MANPCLHAEVDVWEADAEGFYDVQRPAWTARKAAAVFRTDDKGRLWFAG